MPCCWGICLPGRRKVRENLKFIREEASKFTGGWVPWERCVPVPGTGISKRSRKNWFRKELKAGYLLRVPCRKLFTNCWEDCGPEWVTAGFPPLTNYAQRLNLFVSAARGYGKIIPTVFRSLKKRRITVWTKSQKAPERTIGRRKSFCHYKKEFAAPKGFSIE